MVEAPLPPVRTPTVKPVEIKQQPEQKVEIPQPEANDAIVTGLPEAVKATVDEAVKAPDKARTGLEVVAGGLQTVRLEKAKGKSLELNIDKQAEELIMSDNPQNKAMGLEFKSFLLKDQLLKLDEAKTRDIRNPNAKLFYEKKIKEVETALEETAKLRSGLKDKDGNVVPDQTTDIVDAATKMASNDNETKLAEQSPLTLIEQKMNEALRNSKTRESFIKVISETMGKDLPEDMKKELVLVMEQTVSKVSSENTKERRKKFVMSLLKFGGGIPTALLLLFAWNASKEMLTGPQTRAA